jgi:hypothetical protein
MKIFFFVAALIFGAIAGITGGQFLFPREIEQEVAVTSTAQIPSVEAPNHSEEMDFLPFEQQFIVPLSRDGKISEHVILSLALEGPEQVLKKAKKITHKLRAAYVVTLYDFAGMGGFDPRHSNGQILQDLTQTLQEQTNLALKDLTVNLLVTNFVRQNA